MSTGCSRWYFVHDGRQAGPVTWDKLQSLARSGRLRPQDPVLREGSVNWQAAQTAKDVEDGPRPPPPPSNATRPPPPPPVGLVNVMGRPGMTNAIEVGEDFAEGNAGGRRGVNGGRLLFGMLLCGGGILGTMAGHSAAIASGRYVIFTGPIIYGLIMIFQAVSGSGREA
jgi:hypothetical protein